ALLQEQSSSSAVFLDCHAPHKCQSYLSFSNDKSYWFIQENVVHNCTVAEISSGLKLSADNPAERIPILMRLSLTFVFLKYLSDKSSISACGQLPASVPVIGGSSAKYCPPYRALLHRQGRSSGAGVASRGFEVDPRARVQQNPRSGERNSIQERKRTGR